MKIHLYIRKNELAKYSNGVLRVVGHYAVSAVTKPFEPNQRARK
jgi:hypothetical protein